MVLLSIREDCVRLQYFCHSFPTSVIPYIVTSHLCEPITFDISTIFSLLEPYRRHEKARGLPLHAFKKNDLLRKEMMAIMDRWDIEFKYNVLSLSMAHLPWIWLNQRDIMHLSIINGCHCARSSLSLTKKSMSISRD